MASDAVSTSLPMITLDPGSTITVNADDSGSIVTQIVVKTFKVKPAPPTKTSSPVLLPASGR